MGLARSIATRVACAASPTTVLAGVDDMPRASAEAGVDAGADAGAHSITWARFGEAKCAATAVPTIITATAIASATSASCSVAATSTPV